MWINLNLLTLLTWLWYRLHVFHSERISFILFLLSLKKVFDYLYPHSHHYFSHWLFVMESDPNVTLLTIATQKITLYCPLIIIIIGTVGCLGNFLTFTSIKLRKNSCSFYFLCATVFDLLTLDFGALTRLLADHFGVMLYHQVRVYCQIRQYLVTSLPALATLFIVLAAMDRFMSTSSRQVYRSFATIRNARWIGFVSTLICLLCYIHYPMYSDLRPMCSLQGGSYGVFTVVFSIIWTSFAPHFLMLVFGFGTYRHISWTRRRVLPANNQQRRIERTEKQLITVSVHEYVFHR